MELWAGNRSLVAGGVAFDILSRMNKVEMTTTMENEDVSKHYVWKWNGVIKIFLLQNMEQVKRFFISRIPNLFDGKLKQDF